MSSSKQDFFTDKFGLYLALGLLGPSRVIEYLDDDVRKERPAVPMYWRSKIMIPDAFRILYHDREDGDSRSSAFSHTKILFFDATFSFVEKVHHRGEKDDKVDLSTQRPSSSRVLVSLGFFLLMGKGSEAASERPSDGEVENGHYVATQALDYQQIMSHVHSLQLDPQSVTAEALASSMAEEFLRQGHPSDLTLQRKIDQTFDNQQRMLQESNVLTANYADIDNSRAGSNTEKSGEEKTKSSPNPSQRFDDSATSRNICVNIPYKSMGDSSGKLLLKCSPQGVTKFSRKALRFLSWDFSKNPNHFDRLPKNSESLLSKKDLVDDAFERWRIQAESKSGKDNDDENPGKQRVESSKKSVVQTSPVGSNATKTIDRHKRRRPLKGMGVLPSARRKRNKGLVYDTK
jgi:hypothetical protein